MSRGRHQSGTVNRVQVRGKHRHQTVQQQSPGHKETYSSSSPLAAPHQTISASSNALSASNLQQSSIPLASASPRTSSPSSINTSVSLIESSEDTKVVSSINNQTKNALTSPVSSPSSSRISTSESVATPMNKEGTSNKLLKEKSLKSDISNKKDATTEKESTTKTKTGNRISRAFHNVVKSMKRSPRSTTMEEKEISLSSKDETEDDEKTCEKDNHPKMKKEKDNITATSTASSKQSTRTEQKNEVKMSRRQRKNSSTSSLAAAMQVKAQKDDIGSYTMRQDYSSFQASSPTSSKKLTPRTSGDSTSGRLEKQIEKEVDALDNKKTNSKTSSSKLFASVSGVALNVTDSADSSDKKTEKSRDSDKDIIIKGGSRKTNSKAGTLSGPAAKKKTVETTNAVSIKKDKDGDDKKETYNDGEKQHLSPDDVVEIGDRIKVFYIRETIYPAKVIQVQQPKNGEQWPRYRVHYDGWNKRYDEWIKRSKIAAFNFEKEKTTAGGPPGSNTEDSEPTSPPSIRKEVTRKDSGMSTASSSSSSSRLDGNSSLTAKKKMANNDRESDTLSKERGANRHSKFTKLAGSYEKESGSRAGTPSSLRGSRTNSPVSTLKRQNSRGSLKKDTDESEAEADRDVEDVLSSDSAGGRKSSRLQKGIPNKSLVLSGDDRARRSNRRNDMKRTVRDGSETDDTDTMKDEEIKDINGKDTSLPTKPKRGRKGISTKAFQDDSESEDNKSTSDSTRKTSTRITDKSNNKTESSKVAQTPTRVTRTHLKGSSSDQDEDPYDFKEPEPFDVCDVKFETPRKQVSPVPSGIAAPNKKLKEEEVKKDSPAENQAESTYVSVTDTCSTGSSPRKVPASNLSSIASSASSVSDEGNFSDEEKPGVKNVSIAAKTSDLTKEDLGSSLAKGKKNKNDRETDKKIVVDNCTQGGSIDDIKEEINKEELSVALSQQTTEPSEVGKPLLPLPKKLQEVFPHLAAIRTTALPGNPTRSLATGNISANQSNPSTNNSNLPKSSCSPVPSQTPTTTSMQRTAIANQSHAMAGRTICTPPIAKQKPITEILESSLNKPLLTTNKMDFSSKDLSKKALNRSRSRSPISLNIVAEDILNSQGKTDDSVTQKKQRRKPTKPTSTELVGSDSESDNAAEEDIEADGDVDSNCEDTLYPKGRIRQQQPHHRKRSSSRAESKKDNRSPAFPSSTSASSNDSSPSKLGNKNSPSTKNKNKSLTTSLTVKPLTSIGGIQSASSMKRKRDLDAASETTESDEDSSSQSRAPPSQHSTKRGNTSSLDKPKRHKKDVSTGSFGAVDQDDLDLACGETIPGSPVHPGQNEIQGSSPEQYPRNSSNQRLSVTGSPDVGIIQGQAPASSVGAKSVAQSLSNSTNLRSQAAPSTHQTVRNSNQNANRLEMPFASVPESVHGPSLNLAEVHSSTSHNSGNSSNIHVTSNQTSNGHTKTVISSTTSVKEKQYQNTRGDGDVESLQGYSSTSQSPTHGEDSAGNNSQSKSPQEQGDLQGDSSEVDMDSISGRGAGSGADSATWPGEISGKMAAKRKPGDRLAATGNILNMRERGSRSPATGSRSPLPTSSQGGKRKKRSRKTSMSGPGGLRGRKRHGSGRNGNGMTPNREDEDSDEDDEANIEIRQINDSRQSTRVSSLGSLDNDALAALSQRSPRASKFNFYVKFGTYLPLYIPYK